MLVRYNNILLVAVADRLFVVGSMVVVVESTFRSFFNKLEMILYSISTVSVGT